MIIVSASGGARMQEGTLSLMQLAKTCAALGRLADAGVPYISLLTDPTTGGVFASFAALGDINIAEPQGAHRLRRRTGGGRHYRRELPEGFQRAEFLFEHGFVDLVVPRARAARDACSGCCATCARRREVGGNGVSPLGRSPALEAAPGEPIRG